MCFIGLDLNDLTEDELVHVFQWLYILDLLELESVSKKFQQGVRRSLKTRTHVELRDVIIREDRDFPLLPLTKRLGHEVTKFDFQLIGPFCLQPSMNRYIMAKVAKRHPNIVNFGRCHMNGLMMLYFYVEAMNKLNQKPIQATNLIIDITACNATSHETWICVHNVIKDISPMVASLNRLEVIFDEGLPLAQLDYMSAILDVAEKWCVKQLVVHGLAANVADFVHQMNGMSAEALKSLSIVSVPDFSTIVNYAPNLERLYISDIIIVHNYLPVANLRKLKTLGVHFQNMTFKSSNEITRIKAKWIEFIDKFGPTHGMKLERLSIRMPFTDNDVFLPFRELVVHCPNLVALELKYVIYGSINYDVLEKLTKLKTMHVYVHFGEDVYDAFDRVRNTVKQICFNCTRMSLHNVTYEVDKLRSTYKTIEFVVNKPYAVFDGIYAKKSKLPSIEETAPNLVVASPNSDVESLNDDVFQFDHQFLPIGQNEYI